MSLNANALTTVATVQAVTGMSGISTGVAERLINAASALIESPRGLNRKLYRDDAIAEKLAGYGDPYLIVTRTPVNSITSIAYDGTALNSSDYEIHDAEQGIIFFPSGTTWTAPRAGGVISDDLALPGMERKLYTVTYDGGWMTEAQDAADDPDSDPKNLPADIEEACIQMVVNMYRKDGKDLSVRSKSVAEASESYARSNELIEGMLPEIYYALLAYRRIVI